MFGLSTIGMLIVVMIFQATLHNSKTNNNGFQGKNNREQLVASSINDRVDIINKAKMLYYDIYKRYPVSNNELINTGLLRSNFNSSKYTESIQIQSDGTIAIENGTSKTNAIFNAKTKDLNSMKNLQKLNSYSSIRNTANTINSLTSTKDIENETYINDVINSNTINLDLAIETEDSFIHQTTEHASEPVNDIADLFN